MPASTPAVPDALMPFESEVATEKRHGSLDAVTQFTASQSGFSHLDQVVR